jgi:hypothetical protein
MSIKFLDLAALDREIAGPVAREFDAINATTSYVGGPAVGPFSGSSRATLAWPTWSASAAEPMRCDWP